jgi:hypothetical protein
VKFSSFLATGCGLQILFLGVVWGISYPATAYTLDYWGSQINSCPYTTPWYVNAGVNTLAFSTGAPILAAGGTLAIEAINQNDVIPGPRASRRNLPTCDF